MKTCRKYLLTTDHYRSKGIISNERVCLIADILDISNRKIKIMKEMSNIVGRELMDTLTRSVVYYSGKSYNLLPKIDKVQDEAEAQLTYESVPEQEAPDVEEE